MYNLRCLVTQSGRGEHGPKYFDRLSDEEVIVDQKDLEGKLDPA